MRRAAARLGDLERGPAGARLKHVVLLRSVNLAGRTLVMAELRAFLVKQGFHDAKTLLASGNIVLNAGRTSPARLEKLLEADFAKAFGFASEVFVRSADEWDAIVARNPFPKEAQQDPARFVLLAMKDEVDAAAVKALQAAIVGRERVKADGRQLYAVYPDGQGESKLTGALIERKLGTRVTARNWNTVLKLQKASS